MSSNEMRKKEEEEENYHIRLIFFQQGVVECNGLIKL